MQSSRLAKSSFVASVISFLLVDGAVHSAAVRRLRRRRRGCRNHDHGVVIGSEFVAGVRWSAHFACGARRGIVAIRQQCDMNASVRQTDGPQKAFSINISITLPE